VITKIKRPKIALRHTTDPWLRLLLSAYILNQGTQAEATALKWINEHLRRG
jgi:hypothetical protein